MHPGGRGRTGEGALAAASASPAACGGEIDCGSWLKTSSFYFPTEFSEDVPKLNNL